LARWRGCLDKKWPEALREVDPARSRQPVQPRHMLGEPRFAPPAEFERAYRPIARTTPRCPAYTAYFEAVALVSAMLAPTLDGAALRRRWVASQGSWQ
jgi:hypothetical protein